MVLGNDVLMTETDYGAVLLDESRGDYWTLNPTGALIVRTLLNGGTERDAASVLTEEYAVDIADAEHDVAELVAELCGNKLLRAR